MVGPQIYTYQGKRAGIFGQLYIYDRKSLLPTLLRCLIGLCGDEGEWSLSVISRVGAKKIGKRKTLSDAFEKLTAAFPGGFNHIEITGKEMPALLGKGISHVKIEYEVNPLNRDWAPIGQFDHEGFARPLRNLLTGLQSLEKYIQSNKRKRCPLFVRIELWFADEMRNSLSISRQDIVDAFRGLIQSMDGEFSKNYIGFIDPGPMNKSLCSNIDTHFDRPHMVTFGPRAVVEKYAHDVGETKTELDIETEEIGAVILVAFKDWKEVSKVYLPKWHEHHP